MGYNEHTACYFHKYDKEWSLYRRNCKECQELKKEYEHDLLLKKLRNKKKSDLPQGERHVSENCIFIIEDD